MVIVWEPTQRIQVNSEQRKEYQYDLSSDKLIKVPAIVHIIQILNPNEEQIGYTTPDANERAKDRLELHQAGKLLQHGSHEGIQNKNGDREGPVNQ